MFLAYLLPVFTSTRDPWRLSFSISAIVVLSGLFAIMNHVAAETKIELALTVSGAKGKPGGVPFSELLATFSSASVGFYLIVFGTLLAGFSHCVLHKREMEVRSQGNSSAT